MLHAEVSDKTKLFKSLQIARVAEIMAGTKIKSQHSFIEHLRCATVHSTQCTASWRVGFFNLGMTLLKFWTDWFFEVVTVLCPLWHLAASLTSTY